MRVSMEKGQTWEQQVLRMQQILPAKAEMESKKTSKEKEYEMGGFK